MPLTTALLIRYQCLHSVRAKGKCQKHFSRDTDSKMMPQHCGVRARGAVIPGETRVNDDSLLEKARRVRGPVSEPGSARLRSSPHRSAASSRTWEALSGAGVQGSLSCRLLSGRLSVPAAGSHAPFPTRDRDGARVSYFCALCCISPQVRGVGSLRTGLVL